MNEAIDAFECDIAAIKRICRDVETLSDADINLVCLLIESEIIARKNGNKKERNHQK